MPRVYRGNRYGLNNDRTKQLEKYDLEINPQEIITSSAPLLMPPLDISPWSTNQQTVLPLLVTNFFSSFIN